jgi:hypothetical protein
MTRSISILVQGAPKTGKSTFAATSPGPRLLIDIEGGNRFLNIKPVRWNPASESPPEDDGSWDTAVVRVINFDDALKAYQWLASGKHPFKSVIIDSISELQQRLIESISGRQQPQMQQWGELLRTFSGLMRDFRDLTEHPSVPLEAVVLVAMSRESDVGLGRPWLQGQSAVVLPYLFDMSVAMDTFGWTDENGQMQQTYRMLIGANSKYETGERVGGRVPPYIDNPTVPAILDYIYGARA